MTIRPLCAENKHLHCQLLPAAPFSQVKKLRLREKCFLRPTKRQWQSQELNSDPVWSEETVQFFDPHCLIMRLLVSCVFSFEAAAGQKNKRKEREREKSKLSMLHLKCERLISHSI